MRHAGAIASTAMAVGFEIKYGDAFEGGSHCVAWV
jgi:hypothetical protein